MAELSAGILVAGRYRLDSRLDSGGKAEVWRASDQELGREVAVKILITPPGADPSFLEDFRAEAQAEAALKHPNIVEVFDWGHDGELNYVVMELLAGRPVGSLLESEGVMSAPVVVNVGRQAAAALAYAHHEGVAHGMLSRDSAVVAPDGRTALIGFGLRCRGTCEIPPTPDADTHALGELMYEMLVGAMPSGARPPSVPDSEPWPEHPHKLVPSVPGELDRIVMKAIAADPAQRYATASALQADLDALAAPKRRTWLWALLAAILVLLAIGATWFLATSSKVVVPDVVGNTTAQAGTTLTAVGLKLVIVGQQATTATPSGTVISENPTSGQKVRRGTQVGVVVSSGVPAVSVPSVAGLSLASASTALSSLGLVVGKVTRQNSDTFLLDTIVSQAPVAAQSVPAGTAVDLVVSGGPAKVTVPDVRGVSESDATSRIEAVGLKTDSTQVYSSQADGKVVSQSPAPGAVVAAGSTVAISVSKGPAPVLVPDVGGATLSAATSSITESGLVPVSSETSGTAAQVGRVISQEPDPGTAVAKGSQVKIVVGK